MELREFEQRTGYFPTGEEYRTIEKFYMSFDGDKDAFCKAYKRNTDGLAEKIQRKTNLEYLKTSQQNDKEITRRDSEIEALKKQLEHEQEWRPYTDTENVSQKEYEALASASGSKKLTDDEAKALLYDWYGFAKEKITIHRTTPIYEVNRHNKLRKIGEYDRPPIYNATDYNYIRFDCGCMCYELQDDTLRPYMH
ncbi:hypothetical protein [Lacrimispora defluvii]|uniref:Uncharacterized protein n=1 Tax=Lacrimispora defluvii TaxID=2719233 RepID=A0ABX1VNY9_9FIRM|nr:hypothetical protein [Lacrimispora defluvii]NNJ30071.1 hypothetical protein [Lacrimispora defluvii]